MRVFWRSALEMFRVRFLTLLYLSGVRHNRQALHGESLSLHRTKRDRSSERRRHPTIRLMAI